MAPTCSARSVCFADRGVRRTWGGAQVLALPGAGQLKARIGDVPRSALPYSA
jgi:hypothetical protein